MASSWMDEANATAKQYADALKKQSQYLIDQQNQAKQNSLNALENDRQNAINNLNSGKDTIRQTALDNAKQANINRMLALKDNQDAMNRAGLASQGIVGSQVNSINSSYGTNLNSILRDKANNLKNVDDQINSANLQYDTNRLNLANQYDQNIANLNSQIDANALNQYNTIYQSILNQKQQAWQNELAELQRQDANRQFELQMAYQKMQDAERNRLEREKLYNNTFNFTDNNSSNIITDYYKGAINSDTQYGTFNTVDKNGIRYQPNNVGGNKLSNSGYRVSDIFANSAYGSSGASLGNQKIWKTSDNNYYVWDGSINDYIDITNKVKRSISKKTSVRW